MAKKSKLEKTIDKQKKAHPVAFLLVVLFLVVGAVAGYFTVQYLTRDDRFEIIGEQSVTLEVGEEYVDEGAVAISFGRDISDKVEIDTSNIDNTKADRYYVKYTVDDIRYNGVVKYRFVVFVDEIATENPDEEEEVVAQGLDCENIVSTNIQSTFKQGENLASWAEFVLSAQKNDEKYDQNHDVSNSFAYTEEYFSRHFLPLSAGSEEVR